MAVKMRKKQLRTDIQVLRAIAVLAVVFYHLWPGRLVGGFMGVDIFFVISGYLMTLTLMRDIKPVLESKKKPKEATQFLLSFYARRIKRLIPASYVALLGTLGLVVLTGSYTMITDTSRQIVASALFFQNWLLAGDSVDYLASTNAPTAVQHYWSLSLEEQFYFVWPLLLLLLVLVTTSIKLMYKKRVVSPAVLPTFLLVIGFFVYGYWLTKTNPSEAYFVTFSRVWELLLGSIIAFLPKLKNHDLKLLLPWLGLAICCYALFKWDGANFPGWHALAPTIGTALIIYGGTSLADSKFSFSKIFNSKILQWIGDISYSLYLWHWPLIILLPVLFAVDIDGENGRLVKIGILVASFFVAWLSYKFVEGPTQRVRIKRRYVFASFIAVVGVVAGSAYFTKTSTEAQVDNQLSEIRTLVKPYSDDKCIGAKWMVNRGVCENGFGVVNESYAQFTTSDHYRKLSGGRMCDFYDYRSPRERQNEPSYRCVVGDVDSERQIAVFGDSHTSHWLNAFNDIGERRGVKFVVFDSRVCGSNEILEPQCKERLDYFKTSGILDKSEVVIMSLLHRSETTLDNKVGNLGTVPVVVKSLTKTPVFLLENTPPSSKMIGGDCIIYDSKCRRKKAGAVNDIKSVSQAAVSQGYIKRSQIIPTDDLFCDSTYCYSLIGGLSVYYNAGRGKFLTNSHMTASYSLSLSLPLEKKLHQYGILKKPSIE